MIKKQYKKVLQILLCVLIALQIVLSCFTVFAAESEEIEYTNAYNDLRSNVHFDESRYPKLSSSNEKYYSLELITIAESENGELFVYVYQPSGENLDLRAIEINIALSDRAVNEDEFKIYKLKFINSHDVYYKYKVEDFTVSSDPVRYYEITQIARAWNSDYGDKDPGAGNTASTQPFAVGKLFTFKTSDGATSMNVEDVEVIRITEKYVGYIRYEGDGLPFYISQASTDAHFVAFSTGRKIDDLLEADVYYEKQDYYYSSTDLESMIDPWGEVESKYKYLDYQQKAECEVSDGSVFTYSEYIWDRIQTTEDFLNQKVPLYIFPGFNSTQNIEFSSEALIELAKTQWVLSFVETGYSFQDYGSGEFGANVVHSYSRVGNVELLRLKFVTDDVVYNLGVVDNKQTGSEDPAAVVEQQEWWQKIMFLLSIVILIVILTFIQGPVGAIAKILWTGIKFIFSLIITIVTLPFRLLWQLIFPKGG